MSHKKIIVLGAGISGLALGWFFKKKFGEDIHLTILEKSHRPGGWIKTTTQEGFLFELGPRSCRPKGSGIETLKLVEELGLQNQLIFSNPAAQKRFLYLNRQLQPFPTGLFSFLISPLMKGVLKACYRDLITPKGSNGDESIYDFFSRRFGSDMAERFADPMTKGIYAGDIKQLSIKSCFPFLYQWEQERGSVLRGAFSQKRKAGPKASLFSFKKGMQTLTDELAKRLEKHLQLESKVKQLTVAKNGIELLLDSGKSLQADYLYSAIPDHALAKLLPEANIPSNPAISLTVVNLGYRKNILNEKGFGYLVPSSENQKILGVVWDSCIFPQQNQSEDETRLTVMLDSERFSEQESLNSALESLSNHMGITALPDVVHIHHAKHAIPQYLVGQEERIKQINESSRMVSDRIQIIGSSFYGVSVNDCISRAHSIV